MPAPSAKVENGSFRVGQRSRVRLAIRPGVRLVPGDSVDIQFPNSWLMLSGPSFTRKLQIEDPKGEHCMSVSAPGARFELSVTERHLNFPEGRARHGRLLTARLVSGSVPASGRVLCVYANTPAPYVAETETVRVRVKGIAPARLPELVTLPGPAVDLRLVAPSSARPGERFEVLAVSLDRFENRSATRYRGRKLELVGGGTVARGLSFAGSIRVPVVIRKEGIWRFRMDGALSNAVRVSRGEPGPFWGDIHIHTRLSSDGLGADPYGYARHVAGLDFAGVTDHAEDLGDEGYRQLVEWSRAAHRPGQFVAVLGDERNPGKWTGHHNVYFHDEASFLRCRLRPGCYPRDSDDESGESMAAILAEPEKCLTIPHHTGISWKSLPKPGQIGDAVDLAAAGDDRGTRPVMEIYSHHGQSELYDPGHILAYEFNRMRNPEKRSNASVPGPFYAQDFWASGRRLGVIGSSDEHTGRGGRRHGGLAAVWAPELKREALFDALRQRRCYATTGERILLDFSVDGVAMGREIRRRRGSRLQLSLAVWGTAGLVRVDLLRCRPGEDSGFRVIRSDSPRAGGSMQTGGVAAVGVPKLVTDHRIELEDEFTGPAVYYARVVQEPLDWPGMAWSSPVWIDAE
jgi:hypothetical protein